MKRFHFRRAMQQRQRHLWLWQALFWLGLPLCTLAYGIALAALLYLPFQLSSQAGEHLWRICSCVAVLIFFYTLLNYVDALLALRQKSASEQALALGASALKRHHLHFDAQRLRNIVAELSLISAVPAPAIFILERDQNINAGVMGGANNSSALLISAGAIRVLKREELSALLAHVFAQIRDEQLAQHGHLAAMVYAYDAVAEWRNGGRMSISVARERFLRLSLIGNRDTGANLLGLILGYTGLIFSVYGHVLQSAYSRSRQFHADARSIELTRNRDALLNVLFRIRVDEESGWYARAPSAEWAHAMFVHHENKRLLATHPSVQERLSALNDWH